MRFCIIFHCFSHNNDTNPNIAERVEINFNKKVFEIYIAKYRIVFINF